MKGYGIGSLLSAIWRKLTEGIRQLEISLLSRLLMRGDWKDRGHF